MKDSKVELYEVFSLSRLRQGAISVDVPSRAQRSTGKMHLALSHELSNFNTRMQIELNYKQDQGAYRGGNFIVSRFNEP